MPKGSELYPAHAQALLRRARMLVTMRPPQQPVDFKEDVADDDLDAEGEPDTGFYVTKWAQVPAHLEQPEPEFLAARRNGLPLILPGAYGPLGNKDQMRNLKVRKYDTDGNAYVWNVMAKVGQKVEGEIVEDDTIMAEAPAPGTKVDGVGVANAEGIVIANEQVMPTPPRRRPPPPKRKAKGPGRGRKKRPSAATGATATSSMVKRDGMVIEGKASEDRDRQLNQQTSGTLHQEDIEMGDESMLQEAEDGSDDEDDDGEDGEDGDREEGELSPSPDVLAIDNPNKRQKTSYDSSPDIPLAASNPYNAPVVNFQPATEVTHNNQHQSTTMDELPIPSEGVDGFVDGDEDLFGSLERALDGA